LGYPPQFEEGTTLDRFLMDTMLEHPDATGQFVNLMQSIALAGKMISSRVNRAGLAGMFGDTGVQNSTGDFVQKLDMYSNDTFLRALEHRGHTCLVVSEEEDKPVAVPARFHSGRYVVAVDPLDGSSNIDCNAAIGTIFGIFHRLSAEGQEAEVGDALRCGRDLVAAGYILYGAGTMMVLGSQHGVHGFTLDPIVGEFLLSHPNIRTPQSGKIFSLNEGYYADWQPGVRAFVDGMKSSETSYKARYIGSLVADFHRNLLKGGVFLYPGTPAAPKGKLRLLYEAFPLAFLVEKAGGRATDGRVDILDKTATTIHERTPLVIGSNDQVTEATRCMSADPEFKE
jgi:fructose-1,6-bisphosphatase I